MKPIVVLGPTGVGKTKLSIMLAKHFNGEIINADSMQIYKNFNIGTAKVLKEEQENIPHHLFDICNEDYIYTVYDYQKDCRRKIKDILNKGCVPIIVGGTGLYIKAVFFNYEFEEEKGEKKDLSTYTNLELFNIIKKYDENSDIHINNRKRLERKVEQILSCENIKTKKLGNQQIIDAYFIGLKTSRDNLYKIIDERVDLMVKNNLLDEVKTLYKYKDNKAFKTGIGYKEWIHYFNGEKSYDEVISLIKQNSRRYAKRQFTFFNHQLPVTWFDVNYQNFDKTVDEVIKYIENN